MAAIYPQTHCGDFTQSLMELGAIICLPNGEPLCGACPLQAECRSRQNGTYGELPIRPQKKQRKIQQKTVFLLTCQGKIALRKREEKGLLAGLWEFPNVSGFLTKDEMVDQLAEWQLGLVKMGKKKKAKHIFTHIEWQMIGYRLECETENQLFTWLSWQDLQGQMALSTAFKPFFTLL